MGAVIYGGSHTAPPGEARIKQTQHQNAQPDAMLCGPQRMAWEGLLGGAEPGIWCYGGNLPDGHEEEKGCVSTAESAQCAPLSLKPVLVELWFL